MSCFSGFCFDLISSFLLPLRLLCLSRFSFAGEADDIIVRPFFFPAERSPCPLEWGQTHVSIYMEEARAQSVEVTCLWPHSDGTAAGGGVHVLGLPVAALPPATLVSVPSPWEQPQVTRGSAACEGDVETGASLWSFHGELHLASCGWLLALGPCPTVRGGGGRTESGQLALSTHAPGPSHPVASLPSQAPLSGPGLVPLGERGLGHPRLMGTAHLNDPEVLATPCTPRPLPREAAGTAACGSKPELEGRMERCINRIIIITAGLSDLQLSGCLASASPPIALGTGHP